MSSLITLADATAALASADLSSADLAALPEVITDATAACEGYCGQGLALASYGEARRPGRERTIRLRNGNVTRITRVATDFGPILQIRCLDASAVRATVENYGGQLLLTPYGGSAATGSLTLSSYATAAQLAAAIAGVAGWTATASNTRGGWRVADLIADVGTFDAMGASCYLTAYTRDMTGWNLKSARNGVLELTEDRADAYRYPDRTWGTSLNFYDGADPRQADVFTAYQAGFDAAAGTVPGDLRRAVLLTISAILNLTDDGGSFKSESNGDWSGQRIDGPILVPPDARRILYRYQPKGV
jgi:hypothetical protein